MIPQKTTTKNCVILCRVSSKKQAQEGESLEDQEKACRSVATERGWTVVPDGKVWSTQISGWKDVRTDYEEMRGFIKSHPKLVHYCLFRSIDRFTRAGMEEYAKMKRELTELGVEMVDTHGVIQPMKNTLEDLGFEYKWSKVSPSEITEAVLSTTYKQEINTILTRMVRQSIKNTQKGYRTRRHTDGFQNKKVYDSEGKKKYIQVPDPERSKYYIAQFEMRARGTSDPEIVQRVNAMGYKSEIQNRWSRGRVKVIIGQRGGKPLTVKQLQRNIQNPIYAGIQCEKWTYGKPQRTQYSGLVSIDLWNRANKGKKYIQENEDGTIEILLNFNPNRTKKKLKDNPLYPWKMVRCHLCKDLGKDKPFLGSAPAGKSGENFPTYHCGRDHKYFGVPKKQFEETIENFVKNLKFNPDFLNGFELTFLNKYRKREKEIVGDSARIHRSIADLKTEQAAKIQAIVATTSVTVRKQLDQEVDELEQMIKNADQERIKIKITESDIKGFVRWAKDLMEHPSEWLLDPSNISSREALFSLVFEEMPTYREIVNGTPKLSIVFKLSSEFTPDKNQLVTLQRIEL